MQHVPHPRFVPAPQPPPVGHARAAVQLAWQQPPGRPSLEYEEDVAEGGTIRDTRSAALGLGRLGRDQRRDEPSSSSLTRRLLMSPICQTHHRV